MVIDKTRKYFYFIILALVSFILTLGFWWLYLIFKLSIKLSDLQHPAIEGNLINMVKWEGLTFFVLLIALSFFLLYLYLQDFKKTKSIQAFFSSLTHELKTPLASMKLQAEVMNDFIEDLDEKDLIKNKLKKYSERLLVDNKKLETQLDNHLQLARIERGANINEREISLFQFLTNLVQEYQNEATITLVNIDNNFNVAADDFALKTVFKNLIENSIKHVKLSTIEIKIEVTNNDSRFISLLYTDNGEGFLGNRENLGTLFYKFNSPQGSGIGLYIVKNLIESMRGRFLIVNTTPLEFQIDLKRVSHE